MKLEDVASYDFTLPKQLIRNTGIEPRDSAKLFVYNTATDTITHDVFKNIGSYLPKKSTLVFNETKVLPARLQLSKSSGGKLEVFVLINEWLGDSNWIPVRADRRLEKDQQLFCDDEVIFTVVGQEGGIFFLSVQDAQKRPLEEILVEYGSTPIPPYIKGNAQTESELRKRYQAVFAKSGASVAAPTASLHFTDTLLQKLEADGIQKTELSLEVGLGTFAPLTEENFRTGKLHTEYVTYTKEFLDDIQKASCLIPVGTTSLRALENVAAAPIIKPGTYPTDIFITPGFSFQYAVGLITNFHTPKSSLMLLVDAFLAHKGAKRGILELYQEAITKDYAFYSFGDSMLIL